MNRWTEFLRSGNGSVEVNRLNGFLAMVGLIAMSAYALVWFGREFDPLAFAGGAALLVGGTGAGVALKDRNVAHAKVVSETGSRPADPPAPAPKVQPALVDEAKPDLRPDYAR